MRRGYKQYGAVFFILSIFVLFLLGITTAETFCVKPAQEFHDALTDVQGNQQNGVVL